MARSKREVEEKDRILPVAKQVSSALSLSDYRDPKVVEDYEAMYGQMPDEERWLSLAFPRTFEVMANAGTPGEGSYSPGAFLHDVIKAGRQYYNWQKDLADIPRNFAKKAYSGFKSAWDNGTFKKGWDKATEELEAKNLARRKKEFDDKYRNSVAAGIGDAATLVPRLIGAGLQGIVTLAGDAERGVENYAAANLAHNWDTKAKAKRAEAAELQIKLDEAREAGEDTEMLERALQTAISDAQYAEGKSGRHQNRVEQTQLENDRALAGNRTGIKSSPITRVLRSAIDEAADDPLLALQIYLSGGIANPTMFRNTAAKSRLVRAVEPLPGVRKGLEEVLTGTDQLAYLSTPAKAGLMGATQTGLHQLGKAIDPANYKQPDDALTTLIQLGTSALINAPVAAKEAGLAQASADLRAAVAEAEGFSVEGREIPPELQKKFINAFRRYQQAVEKYETEAVPKWEDDVAIAEAANKAEEARWTAEQIAYNRNLRDKGRLKKLVEGAKREQFGDVVEGDNPANVVQRELFDVTDLTKGKNFGNNSSEGVKFVRGELTVPYKDAFGVYSKKNAGNKSVMRTQINQRDFEAARKAARRAVNEYQLAKQSLDKQLRDKAITQEEYAEALQEAYGPARQAVNEAKNLYLSRPVVGKNGKVLLDADGEEMFTGMLPWYKVPDDIKQLIRQNPEWDYGLLNARDAGSITDAELRMLADEDPVGTFMHRLETVRNGKVPNYDASYSKKKYADAIDARQKIFSHFGGAGFAEAESQQAAFARAMAESRASYNKLLEAIAGKDPQKLTEIIYDPALWQSLKALEASEPEVFGGVSDALRKELLARVQEKDFPLYALGKARKLNLDQPFFDRTEEQVWAYRPDNVAGGYTPVKYQQIRPGMEDVYVSTDRVPEISNLTGKERRWLKTTEWDRRLKNWKDAAEPKQIKETPIPEKPKAPQEAGEWIDDWIDQAEAEAAAAPAHQRAAKKFLRLSDFLGKTANRYVATPIATHSVPFVVDEVDDYFGEPTTATADATSYTPDYGEGIDPDLPYELIMKERARNKKK